MLFGSKRPEKLWKAEDEVKISLHCDNDPKHYKNESLVVFTIKFFACNVILKMRKYSITCSLTKLVTVKCTIQHPPTTFFLLNLSAHKSDGCLKIYKVQSPHACCISLHLKPVYPLSADCVLFSKAG